MHNVKCVLCLPDYNPDGDGDKGDQQRPQNNSYDMCGTERCVSQAIC